MVLELNASDESGIEVIRGKVIGFMKQARRVTQSVPPELPGACHRFTKKILILDEADQLTPAAQACLRVPLEDCSSHTLVIILGNHMEHLLPALRSRALRVEFSGGSQGDVGARLRWIGEQEGLGVQGVRKGVGLIL